MILSGCGNQLLRPCVSTQLLYLLLTQLLWKEVGQDARQNISKDSDAKLIRDESDEGLPM